MLTSAASTAVPLVLVIDDELLVHRALHRALERGGCEYVGALDGEEGLRVARERKPDAILLDVSMPESDGRDVLVQLKRDPRLSDVPVVMITAHVDSTTRTTVLREGAHDVVEKPFDAVIVQRRICWTIEKRRTGSL